VTDSSKTLLGAVIAGGRSSRFGGDKAMALLDGEPLIAHAVASLRSRCDAVLICGRAWADLPGVPDWPEPDLGPLGGIAAALRYAAAHGFARVLTIGCDMPRIPQALFAGLADAPPAHAADAPILGCWPVGARELLEARLLGGGERSIRGWARAIGAQALPWPAPLANINTPADLARL
jgi:molybdopterin-guanine dinucleotide biosynthesis protein A